MFKSLRNNTTRNLLLQLGSELGYRLSKSNYDNKMEWYQEGGNYSVMARFDKLYERISELEDKIKELENK